MHELPLVKSIFKAVIDYANENNAKHVDSVYLQIGVLRDIIPEFVLKYWKYISKDTLAENSHLYIEEIPASAKCSKCGTVYIINHEDIESSVCPNCGYEKGYMMTGREVVLDKIEINGE